MSYLDMVLRPVSLDGHPERQELPKFWDEGWKLDDYGSSMLVSGSLEDMRTSGAGIFNCLDLEIDVKAPLDIQ